MRQVIVVELRGVVFMLVVLMPPAGRMVRRHGVVQREPVEAE